MCVCVFVIRFVLPTAPAGYDEVDKQAGDDNDENKMDTNENKTEDKENDSSEAPMDEDKKNDGNEPEEPKPKDYFTLCLVNGYGSQVLRNLTDDDTPLTLNS